MGKPSNVKTDNGCVATSSNCVGWQGGKISIIDICKGTSLTSVIEQLACLLKEVLSTLDADNYDVTCLNLSACEVPHTFPELFQMYIDKICELQGLIVPVEGGGSSAIPVVNVATCLQGTLGVSALITDYIEALGALVCEIQLAQQNQQTAILQIIERLDILEA
jgi:hypothetical protein